MSQVTLPGAYALALWLRTHTPVLYMALVRQAQGAGLSGLGECGCHKSSLHGLGQETLDFFTPSLSAANYAPDPFAFNSALPQIDITSSFSTPPVLDTLDPSTFQPITVTETALPDFSITVPNDPATVPYVANSSPGFLASVGKFLTTGGGIAAALNLTGQVIQNQTARTVANAQIARVAAGNNPAAISYRVDPATGRVVPVLATPGGAYPVNPSLLSRLAPNVTGVQIGSFLSQNILWIALAAGVGMVLLLKR